MSEFDPEQIIQKLQNNNTLNDKDFLAIAEYLPTICWHIITPTTMLQQIIFSNPDCIAEILKIRKHYTLQHYITMAILSPLHIVTDQSETEKNLVCNEYGLFGLPIKNIEKVCDAVRNI